MSTTETLPLLLKQLRLPSLYAHWKDYARQAEKSNWDHATYFDKHDIIEKATRLRIQVLYHPNSRRSTDPWFGMGTVYVVGEGGKDGKITSIYGPSIHKWLMLKIGKQFKVPKDKIEILNRHETFSISTKGFTVCGFGCKCGDDSSDEEYDELDKKGDHRVTKTKVL